GGGDTSHDINIAGIGFPGIPGVILGFTDHVAWGGTTADYDVTDVYRETFTTDGSAVVFNGGDVPLPEGHETIQNSGGAPLEYDVLIVPHHGPIVPQIVAHKIVPPNPSAGALSVKWTGLVPTGEAHVFVDFARMKNVEDARAALRSFGVGALNWVFGD